ncbi:hypothetical protein K474DRAFT_1751280 [Panus rudis PR-1116 ss-1]|nr:hypothetical protein K474DRAFT_1751280 [Panus rudis PR-1116 ss-1]
MLFPEHVVNLIMANETATRALPPHVIVQRGLVEIAAHQYFTTLRGWYSAQNNADRMERRMSKNTKNTRRQRKRRKADALRKAVPLFRAKYGEDETVGLEQLIHADYQSSEHSEGGESNVDEFQKYRKEHGGSDDGLEICREQWRSPQLNRVYYSLKKIGNEQITNKSCRRERAGRAQRLRFRGMAANANDRVPPVKLSKRPCFSYVNESWAIRTSNENIPMLEDPEEWSILSLSIPDEDIDDDNRAWLGDDEAE